MSVVALFRCPRCEGLSFSDWPCPCELEEYARERVEYVPAGEVENLREFIDHAWGDCSCSDDKYCAARTDELRAKIGRSEDGAWTHQKRTPQMEGK